MSVLQLSGILPLKRNLSGIKFGWLCAWSDYMSMKSFARECAEMRKIGVRARNDERRQRITAQDLTSFKNLVLRGSRTAPIWVLLSKFVGELISDVRSAMHVCQSNRLCKRYGHAINHTCWDELFPQCRDCGSTIRSYQDLRSWYVRTC